MGWHLTWQDPVALALLAGAVLFARWLRRRVTPQGCDACSAKTGASSGRGAKTTQPPKPTVIGLERLRLGKSFASGPAVSRPRGTAPDRPATAPGAGPRASSPRG